MKKFIAMSALALASTLAMAQPTIITEGDFATGCKVPDQYKNYPVLGYNPKIVHLPSYTVAIDCKITAPVVKTAAPVPAPVQTVAPVKPAPVVAPAPRVEKKEVKPVRKIRE